VTTNPTIKRRALKPLTAKKPGPTANSHGKRGFLICYWPMDLIILSLAV